MTRLVPLFIDGEFRESQTSDWVEVTNPATNDVIAYVPCSTNAEMKAAIESAQTAFQSWKEVAVSERARLMLRYQHLLKEHHDEIATLLSHETGKIFADAKGDVWRGIEVVEQAANIASNLMGETVENVATEIDSYSLIQPLGVCCGITPFNFPAMIPLWMFPIAIASGNTFVLKPSEQVPLTSIRLAELFEEAGAPKGVLQILHGRKEQVDFLLAHPDIRAVSFVGSVPVAQYIYTTGTQYFKRVQAFAGAKITWLSCLMLTKITSSTTWLGRRLVLQGNVAWRFQSRCLLASQKRGLPISNKKWRKSIPALGMMRMLRMAL